MIRIFVAVLAIALIVISGRVKPISQPRPTLAGPPVLCPTGPGTCHATSRSER